MKKIISIILGVVFMCVFAQSAALAEFDVNWTKSTDHYEGSGNDEGYYTIANWLTANTVAFQDKPVEALAFAENGYIGKTGGANTTDPFYWSASPEGVTFQIYQEFGDYKDQNYVKYYTQGDTSSATDVFSSGTDNGPVTIDIGTSFGLNLLTKVGDNFYTDNSLNTYGPQALIYEIEPGKQWLVAWEDLKCDVGDNDYNDMFLKVEVVPEPISMALFLLGGGALVVGKLRKKKK